MKTLGDMHISTYLIKHILQSNKVLHCYYSQRRYLSSVYQTALIIRMARF